MRDNLTPPADAVIPSQAPDETFLPHEKTTPWLTFAAIALSSLIIVAAPLSNQARWRGWPGWEWIREEAGWI